VAILAERRRRGGDGSPAVVDAAVELALTHQRPGDVAEARALEPLFEATLGADLPARLAALDRVAYDASEAIAAGDFARALALDRLAVATLAQVDAPRDVHGAAIFGLAQTAELAGEWVAARDAYRQATAIAVDPGQLADAHVAIAALEVELGDAAAAIAPAREALTRARQLDDAERIQTASLVLARALLATGHPEEVLDLLEPVLRALDTAPAAPPVRRAGAAFGLAQALWETGGARERDRARVLADDAIRDFGAARDGVATGAAFTTIRRSIDARLAAAVEWRRRHR
jgi:tetratricopeptide (TPR) repeat protein